MSVLKMQERGTSGASLIPYSVTGGERFVPVKR
jgi:hypothetical protein